MLAKVGSEGPRNAKLAIVAEKPGRQEVVKMRPLIGPTGQQVNELLAAYGIKRQDVYLTNAVKVVKDFNEPTDSDIIDGQMELYDELSQMPELKCIIALGNVALKSLSNFHYQGITKYRGSVLPSCIGIKMVPTFHPSFYFRGAWHMKSVVKFDFGRAIYQADFAEIRRPARTFIIEPTLIDVMEWTRRLSRSRRVAFDIEVVGGFITCIAFSNSPDSAICIPITHNNGRPYWSDINEERQVWDCIQQIFLNEKTIFIAQNMMFDVWHLYKHGIVVPHINKGRDTMNMHKLLAPELNHDLAFLTSIYTDEPYYKDESGYNEEVRVSDEQFWAYNCKDASVTFEVCQNLEEELEQVGLLEQYINEVQAQYMLCLKMRIAGIRVDVDRLRRIREEINSDIKAKEDALIKAVGRSFNTKSGRDMEQLYSLLGVPAPRTDKGSVKRDKYTLLEMAHKHREHADVLSLIHNINELRTLRDGFTNIVVDNNDYYHPGYKPCHTKSRRMASESSEQGGPQLQNIPRKLRSIFIPDRGHMFTSCDMKQAEAMLVAWMAEDKLLIKAFEEGKDVHRVRACILYRNWTDQENLPPDELLSSITKVCQNCEGSECVHSERFNAKVAGHAFAYRMGESRFIKEQIKIQLFINKQEAARIRRLMISDAIKRWHDKVMYSLRHSRWLTAPTGAKREFYGILDDDMLREALSWLASVSVSQIITRAELLLDDWFSNRKDYYQQPPRIVTQTHDSLLVSHDPADIELVKEDLITAFNQPTEINGRILNIPIEITHGYSWGELK